jgi:serine/threonine-protein kinase
VRAGDVLAGKYRVERVLGAGGMGVVLAAQHLDLEKRVAIKLMRAEMLADAGSVARFLREARAAVRIESEHVARVLDVGRIENGAPYLVMEFLEGVDLQARLRERGPMPVPQAVDFLVQACVGVAEAHALGIVHRDLKPANLFLIRRSDGQPLVKVLDFGISKLADLGSESGMSVTKTGSVMGSPLYMSPEQMRSAKDVDARSDIWALGVILFELLTGRTPFLGTTLTEVTVQVITEPPPPVRSLRPDVPGGLEAVIQRCLEKDRRVRFSNVAEVARALVDFGPPRLAATVERISGIAHASGQPASAPARSPSSTYEPAPVRREETLAAPETMAPFGRTAAIAPIRRTRAVWALALGGVALVAAAGALTLALHRTADPAQSTGGVAAGPESATTIGPVKPGPDTPVKLEPPVRLDPPVTGAEPPASPTPMGGAGLPSAAAVAGDNAPGRGPAGRAAATGTSSAARRTGLPAGPGAATSAAAGPPTPPPAAKSTPCKLIQTVDKEGETHFSCPCPVCE